MPHTAEDRVLSRENRGAGVFLAERLSRWWRRDRARTARLAILERVSLGPKQVLSLVEADGTRLLVATSAEGHTVFHRLGVGASIADAGANTELAAGPLAW